MAKSRFTKSFFRYVTAAGAAAAVAITYQGCSHYDTAATSGFGLPSLIGAGDGYWSGYVNNLAGYIELLHAANVVSPTDYISVDNAPVYTTGFTGLSVISVGPPTNGAPAGATSYGLQIPGFALFFAPFQTAGSIVGMIVPACTGVDMTGNFIVLRPASTWSNGLNNGDAFGTATYTFATGAIATTHDYNLDVVASNDSSTDMGVSQLSGGGGCNSGTFWDGVNEAFTGLTSLFVHNNIKNTIYMLLQSGTPPTVASLAGNYAGILYNAGTVTNSPFTLTLAPSGGNVTGTATIVSDVSTGASAGGTNPVITLGNKTLADPNASGFVAGTINFTGTDRPLVCLPQTSAGGTTQTLLGCTGEDDGSPANFVSLVLVSH